MMKITIPQIILCVLVVFGVCSHRTKAVGQWDVPPNVLHLNDLSVEAVEDGLKEESIETCFR